MKVFGLTGGIGMGKTMAAQLLRKRGAQVVDTDELARQLVEPGRPALAEIQELFGKNVVAPGGQLRREALAQISSPTPPPAGNWKAFSIRAFAKAGSPRLNRGARKTTRWPWS